MTCFFPAMGIIRALLTGCFLIGLVLTCRSATLLVPGVYSTIQDAIDAAVPGDEILVAPGTYEGPGNIDLILDKRLSVRSIRGAHATIIHAGFGSKILTVPPLLGLDRTTVFDGFTIRRGYSERGAMEIRGDIKIVSCIFEENESSSEGGALWIDGSPCLQACLFIRNTAAVRGGAVVVQNGAPVFDRCTFFGNNSGMSASCLYASRSKVTVANSIIRDSLPISGTASLIRCYYSNVRDSNESEWSQEGCFDLDPGFINPEANDFNLSPGSLCLDAGDPFSRLDADGSRADMGCMNTGGDMPDGVLGGMLDGTIGGAMGSLIVGEDIIVGPSASLVLQSPLELRFRNGAALISHGSLSSEGSAAVRVLCVPDRDGDWFGGIRSLDESFLRLNGLTIDSGAGTLGGGLYIFRADAVVNYTTVQHSWAGRLGGGVCVHESDPLLFECDAVDCMVLGTEDYGGRGGGFSFRNSDAFLVYSRADRNSATRYGAGIYSDWDSHVSIASCMIRDNTCLGSGAGISCQHLAMRDTVITGNHAAEGSGGAWFFDGSAGECTVAANRADMESGGISTDFGQIYVSLVTGNHATIGGGGIVFSSSQPQIHSCTYSGNIAESGGGLFIDSGSRPKITNCIFWDNSDQIVSQGFPVITYSDIQDGLTMPWFGEGCIDKDPIFVEVPLKSYLLSQKAAGQPVDSPCIDRQAGFAEDICFFFNTYETCLDETTTRTDSVLDSGLADMGFHYLKKVVETPTPLPSRTPYPTSTPRPSVTPTPTCSVTPSPQPEQPTCTPTPVCPVSGLSIDMPGDFFLPGSNCFVRIDYCMRDEKPRIVRFYSAIEISGSFFFHPEWTGEMDSIDIALEPGPHEFFLIDPFDWPAGCGSFDNAGIWAVMLDKPTGELVFPVACARFSWAETAP